MSKQTTAAWQLYEAGKEYNRRIGLYETVRRNERFYRGDKSHSTEIEGTGLGLSITKSVIVLHRGVIKVSSMLGKGTTFMVRIPLVRQEN